jgi:hypothetical protein
MKAYRVLWRGYVYTVVAERAAPHDARGAAGRECQIRMHGTTQWVHADRLTVVR